jgi:hypothetical protein
VVRLKSSSPFSSTAGPTGPGSRDRPIPDDAPGTARVPRIDPRCVGEFGCNSDNGSVAADDVIE